MIVRVRQTVVTLAVLLAACQPGAGSEDPTAAPSPAGGSSPASSEAAPGAGLVGEQLGVRPATTRRGQVDVRVTSAEATPEGVRVGLHVFNGGDEPFTLLDDPATVYADPAPGDGANLPLLPPDGLPVVVQPGAQTQLDLAFAGDLDPATEFIDVYLNHDDGEPLEDPGLLVFAFQLDPRYAPPSPAPSTAPSAQQAVVYPQDRTTEVADVAVTATSVEDTGESVFVTFEVVNRRGTPIRLFDREDTTYLLDQRARRLPGVLPADDQGRLQPGEEATVRLGFRGGLVDDVTEVSMYLNYENTATPVTEPGDELVSVRLINLQVTEPAP